MIDIQVIQTYSRAHNEYLSTSFIKIRPLDSETLKKKFINNIFPLFPALRNKKG